MNNNLLSKKPQDKNTRKRFIMSSSLIGKYANPADIGSKVKDVIDGTFLTKESILKHAPFFLTLVGLAFIYITINYYSNRVLINIEKTKDEVKELRYEYVTVKSELTQFTKASNVSKVLEPLGLKQSATPPQKIIID